jgi:hypothetical protein
MSDNGHGGARRGAGRKPGSKNKISKRAENQEFAAKYVAEVLEPLLDELYAIALSPDGDVNARIRAIRELLDRGLGRSVETIEVSAEPSSETAASLSWPG